MRLRSGLEESCRSRRVFECLETSSSSLYFFDFFGLENESGLGRLPVRSGDSLACLFPFPSLRSGDRSLRRRGGCGLPAFLELVFGESRMRDFFLESPLGLGDLFLFELTFFLLLLFLFFLRFLSSSEDSEEESDELLEDEDDDDEEEEDVVALAFFFLALLDAKCSRKSSVTPPRPIEVKKLMEKRV